MGEFSKDILAKEVIWGFFGVRKPRSIEVQYASRAPHI